MNQGLSPEKFLQLLGSTRNKNERVLRQHIYERTKDLIDQIATNHDNLNQFIEQVVNLICDQFGLYFVGLFLIDGDWVRLRAGSGEKGVLFSQRANAVPVAHQTAIGEAIRHNEIQVVANFTGVIIASRLPAGTKTTPIAPFEIVMDNVSGGLLKTPYFPDALVSITIPLRTKQKIIGGLEIYTLTYEAFVHQDIAIFLSLADQVAQVCSSIGVGPLR